MSYIVTAILYLGKQGQRKEKSELERDEVGGREDIDNRTLILRDVVRIQAAWMQASIPVRSGTAIEFERGEKVG